MTTALASSESSCDLPALLSAEASLAQARSGLAEDLVLVEAALSDAESVVASALEGFKAWLASDNALAALKLHASVLAAAELKVPVLSLRGRGLNFLMSYFSLASSTRPPVLPGDPLLTGEHLLQAAREHRVDPSFARRVLEAFADHHQSHPPRDEGRVAVFFDPVMAPSPGGSFLTSSPFLDALLLRRLQPLPGVLVLPSSLKPLSASWGWRAKSADLELGDDDAVLETASTLLRAGSLELAHALESARALEA
jgi:hypothetical protein